MQAVLYNSHSFFSSKLSCFIPNYSELENRISEIGKKQLPLDQEDKKALHKGIALCQRRFFVPKKVKDRILNLPVLQLNVLINDILSGALEKDMSNELKKLLQVFSEKQLGELASLTNLEEIQVRLNIKSELKNEALQSFLAKEGGKVWLEVHSEIKTFLNYFVEMIIATTGVDDLTDRYGGYDGYVSGAEAQMRLKMYLDFLLYPGTVFGMVLTYVKNFSAAIAITASLFIGVISFVAIYKRYLRSCPIECRGLENMNLRKTKTDEEPIYPRLNIFRRIDQAFQAKKGAILIGDSGAGKTSVVQSYVKRVREGKSYQLGKNLQFFQADGYTFKSYDGFSYYEKKFAFWPKEVAFFIKEFHSLFKDGGLIGEQSDALKTFHDRFPYLIVDTTTSEYKQYIEKNETIKRRFEIIHIPQMIKEEVIDALNFYLHAKFPYLEVEKGTIEKIYKKADRFRPEKSKIDSATALLSRAIFKVTDLTFEDLQQEINQLETDLNAIKYRMLHEESTNGDLERLIQVQNKLTAKIEELEKGKKALAKIRKVEKVYSALKEKSYRLAPLALSDKKGQKDSLMREVKQGKALRDWLENEALLKYYDSFIRTERQKLGLAPCLNKNLIKKIMLEVTQRPLQVA